MTQRSYLDLDGTMYFVTDAGRLYLKVPGGWKEIQVTSPLFGSSALCFYLIEFDLLWVEIPKKQADMQLNIKVKLNR